MFERELVKIKALLGYYFLTRTLRALIGTKKGTNPHKRYPDAYYGRIAFDKTMFQGIELVAKIERLSKKKAARLLIEKGFSSYMGKKLSTYVEDERTARELNQKPEFTRFVLELRKLARERGMDISQLI